MNNLENYGENKLLFCTLPAPNESFCCLLFSISVLRRALKLNLKLNLNLCLL